jgi:hypothetical protein
MWVEEGLSLGVLLFGVNGDIMKAIIHDLGAVNKEQTREQISSTCSCFSTGFPLSLGEVAYV